MKTTTTLLVIALFLSACSTPLQIERDPASPDSAVACKDIVTSFLGPSKFDAEGFKKKLQLEATTDQLANYFYAFREVNLNSLNDEQIRSMRSIYLFSQDDKPLRDELVAEFIKTIKGEPANSKNKNWDRFLAHKKKLDKYREKKMASAKSAEQKNGLEQQTLIYEKLYMSCKSHVQKNQQRPIFASLSTLPGR